jgi:hypothetical protein
MAPAPAPAKEQTPIRRHQRLLVLLAATGFLAWIGWLLFLAMTAGRYS